MLNSAHDIHVPRWKLFAVSRFIHVEINRLDPPLGATPCTRTGCVPFAVGKMGVYARAM